MTKETNKVGLDIFAIIMVSYILPDASQRKECILMKKIVVFILFLFIFLTSAFAQTSTSIGLGLGGSFTGFREETDTHINRYLNALTYNINGSVETSSFLHSFFIDFYTGEATVHRDYQEFHDDYAYWFLRGRLQYALDYSLWNIMGNESFPGYLGGAFRIDGSYFEDTSGYMDSPKVSAMFSIGVHATQKWLIDPRQTLTLSAMIPLFTYAVRPAFAGVDELWSLYAAEAAWGKIFGLGSFASIHNYWAISSNLNYSYALSSLISLNSNLGLEFSHINVPKHRPRRDAALRLYAGIAFNF
jgi:hypothetical protein